MPQAEKLQELMTWLRLPTPRGRYHYLKNHLELLTCEYDHLLDVFVDLFADQPYEQKRLRVEQRVFRTALSRGRTAEAVRQAYIDEYTGLVLGLPSALEEVERLLAKPPAFDESERARSIAKILLGRAIERLQTDPTVPAEVLAELQYRLGRLFAQDLSGQSRQVLTKVIHYYEAALLIYRRNRYPRQHAKVQAAIGDAYRFFQSEDQADLHSTWQKNKTINSAKLN